MTIQSRVRWNSKKEQGRGEYGKVKDWTSKHNVKRSHEKVDVELMNSLIENVLSGQQDHGLTDGLWLIEEQNRWKKMKLHLI